MSRRGRGVAAHRRAAPAAWLAVASLLGAAAEPPPDPAGQGAPAGPATMKVTFHDELGSLFKLQELHATLDGQPVQDLVDGGAVGLAGKGTLELFSGTAAPGKHQVVITLVYVGRGFGVFSYVEGYQFNIRTGKAFVVEEGQDVEVAVTAYDKGNITSELKDRPAVRYTVESRESSQARNARVAREVAKRQAGVGTAQVAGAAAPLDTSLLTADEFYEVRVKALRERIDDLGARITRSKQRLSLLQDAVLNGVSASRAHIIHRNEVGASFKLREIHYFLDGAPLREEVDETGETLARKDEFDLFVGAIVPGDHQLTVNLVYQGSGVGVFSYLNEQQVKLRSTHTFRAEVQQETIIKVVAFESGSAQQQTRDRATIRYDAEVRALPAPKAPPAAAPAPAEAAAAP